ncbi:hypothetical protein DITRI_Ditri05aG0164500 [Diplodiscus trichospermus]
MAGLKKPSKGHKDVTWNYQGLGFTLTVQTLKGLRKSEDPDMVFLMETKNKEKRVQGIREKMGFKEGVVVDSEGKSKGLALWWKDKVRVEVIEKDKNLIDIRFETKETKEKGRI